MADPKPTYAHVISKLRDQHPNLAYLNVVEPRIEGGAVTTLIEHLAEGISNDFIRDIWGDRPLISAGGYVRNTAMKAADEKGDLVAFSRLYIANVSVFLLRTPKHFVNDEIDHSPIFPIASKMISH